MSFNRKSRFRVPSNSRRTTMWMWCSKVFISSHGNNLKTSSKSASLFFCRKIGLYPVHSSIVCPRLCIVNALHFHSWLFHTSHCAIKKKCNFGKWQIINPTYFNGAACTWSEDKIVRNFLIALFFFLCSMLCGSIQSTNSKILPLSCIVILEKKGKSLL